MIEGILHIAIALLILTGSIFLFIAALGVLRLPDIYSRMHAVTKATSFGILLLLLAFCLYFFHWIMVLKSFLVIVFIYLTAPLAAHGIAKLSRIVENEKKV